MAPTSTTDPVPELQCWHCVAAEIVCKPSKLTRKNGAPHAKVRFRRGSSHVEIGTHRCQKTKENLKVRHRDSASVTTIDRVSLIWKSKCDLTITFRRKFAMNTKQFVSVLCICVCLVKSPYVKPISTSDILPKLASFTDTLALVALSSSCLPCLNS